jgi:shikimate dehydrogenase
VITGKTSIVGLIGNPVGHSLSPPMHNAAFAFLDLDYVYIPFQVETAGLERAIKGAEFLNIKGLNVTIPHKTNVLKHLTSLDKPADLIGAVNTIKFEKHESKGYNTDGIGAIKALEELTPVKNKNVLMVGAGGAARAIAFQLIISDVENLSIINRTPEKAHELKSDIEMKMGTNQLKTSISSGGLENLKNAVSNADILIDTTPIGMYPHADDKPVVSAEMMHSELVVNDLVYNPLETALIKEAKKAGAKTVSGLKMLIYQGAESFKIWTGKEAPVDVMEKALMNVL